MSKNFLIFLVLAALLLGGGAWYRYRMNAADSRGATKLMRSFEQDTDKRAMMRLIRHTENVNERDKAGQTALFYAVEHKADLEVIRHLLRMGADVTLTDKQGRTVLLPAIRQANAPELIDLFLTAGVDINAADKKGQTALLVAAQHASPAVVKKLLRAGADPDLAAADGKTVAELLEANEQFSKEEKDNFRQALIVLSIIGPLPRTAVPAAN